MNTNPMRHFLFLGLWLVSIPAWTQQSAPSSAADSSPQIATSHDASNVPLKTADGMPACPADFETKSLPEGEYRGGGSVLAPKATYVSEPEFSDEGRKFGRKFMKENHVKEFEAESIVGLIVDTKGRPRDICVTQEAGHGLDRKAVETVTTYRFKPGTRDNKPVSVQFKVAIYFRLY